ncbi:MAG: tetratricopeptide repeat protein [Deltaproteobacteria bacterium]|nr:tetratricopeptide repeat protein [Deltaproteobacteria bacterium]
MTSVALALVALAVLALIVMVLRRPKSRPPAVSADPASTAPAGSSAAAREGVVLFRDNDWERFSFDGVGAEWAARQSPRGFFGVPPGRHFAVTELFDGRKVRIDFVLYPGETLVRRLDREAGEWVPDDPETELRYKELARGGGAGAMASALIDYFMTVGTLLRRTAKPGGGIGEAAQTFAALAERLVAGAPLEELQPAAAEAGIRLVGQPLSGDELTRLTGLIDATASACAVGGNFRSAAGVALLGLCMLPGDPQLLEALANFFCDGGQPDAAMERIQEALARADVVDGRKRERIHATRAEVLCHLGRFDEASRALDEIEGRAPGQPDAARVRALLSEKRQSAGRAVPKP